MPSDDADDTPLWDPDRMLFADLDLSNLAAIDAYLEHPVTNALHDDVARAFLHEPPDAQAAVLWGMIATHSSMLAELIPALELAEDDQHRQALDGLRDVLTDSVRRALARIDVLGAS
jgi:hypothetical protein